MIRAAADNRVQFAVQVPHQRYRDLVDPLAKPDLVPDEVKDR